VDEEDGDSGEPGRSAHAVRPSTRTAATAVGRTVVAIVMP
jgi:hypothetical protein